MSALEGAGDNHGLTSNQFFRRVVVSNTETCASGYTVATAIAAHE
jgi:hypothetical protein